MVMSRFQFHMKGKRDVMEDQSGIHLHQLLLTQPRGGVGLFFK